MFGIEIKKEAALGRRVFYTIVTQPRPNVRRYTWRCDNVPAGKAKPGS